MGFRGKHRALNCILEFTSDIEHYSALQHNSLAVFLDITKTYDNFQPLTVIRRLMEMGITGAQSPLFVNL